MRLTAHDLVQQLLGTLASAVTVAEKPGGVLTLTCRGVRAQVHLIECPPTLGNADGPVAFTGPVSGDARVNLLHPLFQQLRADLSGPLDVTARTPTHVTVDGVPRPHRPALDDHHALAVLTESPAGVDAAAVWTSPGSLCAAYALDLTRALARPVPAAETGAYL